MLRMDLHIGRLSSVSFISESPPFPVSDRAVSLCLIFYIFLILQGLGSTKISGHRAGSTTGAFWEPDGRGASTHNCILKVGFCFGDFDFIKTYCPAKAATFSEPIVVEKSSRSPDKRADGALTMY